MPILRHFVVKYLQDRSPVDKSVSLAPFNKNNVPTAPITPPPSPNKNTDTETKLDKILDSVLMDTNTETPANTFIDDDLSYSDGEDAETY